jgi:hypothetical protein
LDWENSIKFHTLKKIPTQEKGENEDDVYEELNEEVTDLDKKNLNLNTNSKLKKHVKDSKAIMMIIILFLQAQEPLILTLRMNYPSRFL